MIMIAPPLLLISFSFLLFKHRVIRLNFSTILSASHHIFIPRIDILNKIDASPFSEGGTLKRTPERKGERHDSDDCSKWSGGLKSKV